MNKTRLNIVCILLHAGLQSFKQTNLYALRENVYRSEVIYDVEITQSK